MSPVHTPVEGEGAGRFTLTLRHFDKLRSAKGRVCSTLSEEEGLGAF